MMEYPISWSEQPTQLGLAGVWDHRKKDGTLIDVEIKWSTISFKGARLVDHGQRYYRAEADRASGCGPVQLGQSLSSAASADGGAANYQAGGR